MADPPGAGRLRLAQGWSVRSVPSRGTRRRAAPTQRSPIASAEAPHLLPHLWPMTPSTTGTWPMADPPGAARAAPAPSRSYRCLAANFAPTQRPPIASAEAPHLLPHLWPMIPSTTGTWPIADPPGAARAAPAPSRSYRCLAANFAPTQRSPIASAEAPHLLLHLALLSSSTTAAPSADSPGAARIAPPRLRSAAYQGTVVITCHLRRPPVASALAAGRGIRRGLLAATPAPAHAFGSDLRRLAPRPAAASGSERTFRPLEEG